MKRIATARWSGGLKDGQGVLDTTSGALAGMPYNFRNRFEEEPGTNPEELIAAAHAGCYAMALSADLGGAGFTPTSINAKATVTLEILEGKPTITSSVLDVSAKVPGIDAAKFAAIAEGTRAGCPVSRALNTKILLNAKLEA
jgi:osmotically inducible protein OsmC